MALTSVPDARSAGNVNPPANTSTCQSTGVAGPRFGGSLESHERVGTIDGQRPEHESVDGAEDGGVGADAERERQQDDERPPSLCIRSRIAWRRSRSITA